MVSNLLKYFFSGLLAIVLALTTGYATAKPAPKEEIRGLWVDEFHAGIRSAEEADQLVAAALQCNANTLFVQVRGRGDALYLQSFEPPREDPAYDPHFDALEYIIVAAHRAGLEVHAWINAMPVWRDPASPVDPRHVFLRHGLGQRGEADWLTRSPAGETKFPVGYFLDPGHPAAAAYLAEVYLNIVRHYAVDGIHFDYIRYPETEGRLPRGAAVGYNATSLARFRRFTGRAESAAAPAPPPAPDDDQWIEWRRRQVTQLVRRVYIEAKAINPKVKVSAAVIAWGRPPHSRKDFSETAPMQRIFQDWRGWLKEGILDLAVPMNYARERDPVVRGWFDGWIRWEAENKNGRQLAVGLGAYLNPRSGTLSQIQRARQADRKHHNDGVSLFSYSAPYAAPVPSAPGPATALAAAQASVAANGVPAQSSTAAEDSAEKFSFLVTGAESKQAVFPFRASIPKMPWIERPAYGLVAGLVRDGASAAADGAAVELKRAGWFTKTQRTFADGNGFFGFANLHPGRYRASVAASSGRKTSVQIEVVAGSVARVELITPR